MKSHRRRFLNVLGVATAASILSAAETDEVQEQGSKVTSLNDLLEPIRAKAKAPALTAAVIADGRLAGVGLVGIRKGGSPVPVQRGDLWHIGSCTKAMTATLIALQVERGRLRWEMTVSEVLTELRPLIAPAYRDVTLEQLLTHRAGLPNQPPADLWNQSWAETGTPTDQRLAFAKGSMEDQPEATPGTKFIYSNQGYTIAAAMLERAMEQPWEKLMREQLFAPLNIRLVGFGAPGTPGQIDQPWGHRWRNNRLEPAQVDNPPAVGPAGTVHCSIWDFARFVAFHLHGARGEGRLLRAETFSRLHYPPEGETYAMGWLRGRAPWADGYTLTHTGSNTLNFAQMWIAPKMNFAAVAVSNIGEESGERATNEAIEAIAAKYAKAA